MAFFADTWFWVCLINKRETGHELANELLKKVGPAPIVTSQLVMFEFLNHCGQLGPYIRTACYKLVKQLNGAPNITVVPYSVQQYDRAFQLYEQVSTDKGWSLTDCASFNIMDDEGLQIAITNDHHFEQHGFQILEP